MAKKDLGSATLGASLTKENTIIAEVGGSIRRIPVSTFISDCKGVTVVSYTDYTNMGSKDTETLYAVTKDGSCDLYLGSIRITNNIQIALTSLSISGSSTVAVGNKEQYTAVYTPADTTQKNVTWSVTSGSAYASIDQSGLLTAKSIARAGTVTIRAASEENPAIYAEKTVSITF